MHLYALPAQQAIDRCLRLFAQVPRLVHDRLHIAVAPVHDQGEGIQRSRIGYGAGDEDRGLILFRNRG